MIADESDGFVQGATRAGRPLSSNCDNLLHPVSDTLADEPRHAFERFLVETSRVRHVYVRVKPEDLRQARWKHLDHLPYLRVGHAQNEIRLLCYVQAQIRCTVN